YMTLARCWQRLSAADQERLRDLSQRQALTLLADDARRAAGVTADARPGLLGAAGEGGPRGDGQGELGDIVEGHRRDRRRRLQEQRKAERHRRLTQEVAADVGPEPPTRELGRSEHLHVVTEHGEYHLLGLPAAEQDVLQEELTRHVQWYARLTGRLS